ncbi:MAG: glutathione S-transferase family protein [SAR324 cluster bacterium]|nr:glutathione S-transferase family protein [SAR324 cluster bacterium]
MSENPPVTVWGRRNSINVIKVMWCINELGVPHERIDVGGDYGLKNAPEYAELNPNVTVPTIRDGEMILWESNVTVRYLSEKYGRGSLYPSDPARRWEAEKWMDWMQTTLNPHLSLILRQLVRTPPGERDMAAVENARQSLLNIWPILDSQLASRQFVAGDSFTMGDIPVGAAAYRWYAFDIERPSFPNLEAWHNRLRAREAYQNHVEMPVT